MLNSDSNDTDDVVVVSSDDARPDVVVISSDSPGMSDASTSHEARPDMNQCQQVFDTQCLGSSQTESVFTEELLLFTEDIRFPHHSSQPSTSTNIQSEGSDSTHCTESSGTASPVTETERLSQYVQGPVDTEIASPEMYPPTYTQSYEDLKRSHRSARPGVLPSLQSENNLSEFDPTYDPLQDTLQHTETPQHLQRQHGEHVFSQSMSSTDDDDDQTPKKRRLSPTYDDDQKPKKRDLSPSANDEDQPPRKRQLFSEEY